MNKDIEPKNDKGEAHGYWEVYNYDTILLFKCYFLNDYEVGYEEDYYYFDIPHININFHL